MTTYQFAMEAHQNQNHGGEPFMKHIDEVLAVMADYEEQGGFITTEMVRAVHLHDVLEDTSTTFTLLSDMFSPHIAHIVDAVTDIDGPTRKIRKDWTIPRIRSRGGYEAVIVKLCDRIANVEAQREDHGKYFQKYNDEYQQFFDALYQKGECEYLWKRLEKSLSIK